MFGANFARIWLVVWTQELKKPYFVHKTCKQHVSVEMACLPNRIRVEGLSKKC